MERLPPLIMSRLNWVFHGRGTDVTINPKFNILNYQCDSRSTHFHKHTVLFFCPTHSRVRSNPSQTTGGSLRTAGGENQ